MDLPGIPDGMDFCVTLSGFAMTPKEFSRQLRIVGMTDVDIEKTRRFCLTAADLIDCLIAENNELRKPTNGRYNSPVQKQE